MANATYEVQANDSASEASVAKVDMKFEIAVIPSRMSTVRRSSTRGSGGDSTPTTTTVRTFV
jgi:hypothetical protein